MIQQWLTRSHLFDTTASAPETCIWKRESQVSSLVSLHDNKQLYEAVTDEALQLRHTSDVFARDENMEEVVKKSGRDMPLSAGVKLKSIQRKRLVIYGLGFFFFFLHRSEICFVGSCVGSAEEKMCAV